MAVTHETVFFDVHDFVVWSMTTDAANASPTYGAAIDVPGIAEVGLDFEFVSAALKGDARTLDRKARIDGLTLAATYGKFDLDVNEVIYGGYKLDEGTGLTERARWGTIGGQRLPSFGARFVIADVDLGLDAIVCTVFKAQITGGTPLGSSTDSYGQPTMEIGGIQPNHLTIEPDDGGVPFEDFTPLVDVCLYADLTLPYTALP